jgi:hypothetical protein
LIEADRRSDLDIVFLAFDLKTTGRVYEVILEWWMVCIGGVVQLVDVLEPGIETIDQSGGNVDDQRHFVELVALVKVPVTLAIEHVGKATRTCARVPWDVVEEVSTLEIGSWITKAELHGECGSMGAE